MMSIPATLGADPDLPLKRRPGQQRAVLARLHGLFPQSPHAENNGPSTRPGDYIQHEKSVPSPTPRKASTVDPRFLKIRILTWNMHDSLPKGDLEELLGKVPLYNNSTALPGTFPNLPKDENHPYHLVVIAGQECPTPSGIPMGLAAGFKLLDKDREKSKEGEKDQERPSSKVKDMDRTEEARASKPAEALVAENLPSGWTSMVEDWLCHGTGSPGRTGSPSTADVGFPKPLMRQKCTKEPRKGPYQLLIKDRLMGIYLAIYIHRDLKPLVQGMSKSAVTAGLIGGRLGNKGGVGISLKIDGTTFLFLNAHLAAHEGKIHHRLGNLAKIKAELAADHFLTSDDPRTMAEDLTDKYDFTFLCGDLNFRLNISRLHADWLISRQEYAQAFEFDQLNSLMKKGLFFEGFREAPINFPPTFKYDVLRTFKRRKRTRSKGVRADDQSAKLTEIEEGDVDEAEEEADEDMEGASFVSSAVTSVNSRPATGPGFDDDTFFYASPSTRTVITSASKVSVVSAGVYKGKPKWLSLLSPSLVTFPNKILKPKYAESWATPSTPTTPNHLIPPSPLSANLPINAKGNGKKRFFRPPPMILVNSTGSQDHSLEEFISEEKGVYDSSHKKRVPSWCDRILWKTTMTPDPTYEEMEECYDPQYRPRNRVGQFFANAFRPSSSRTLRDPNAASFSPTSSGGQIIEYPPPSAITAGFSPSPRLPTTAAFKHLDSRVPRRANTAFSPPPTAPLPSELPPRRSTDFEGPLSPERSQSANQSIWRFLPAFLSPTHNQGGVMPEVAQPASPLPLKGDVVCLSYDTLDDRRMRLLEGRSDHRPVIGTYAVYI